MPTFDPANPSTSIQMKPILNTLAVLAFGLLLAACSGMFYPKSDALSEVKQGMTPQQVTRLLGRPDYRRLNYDLEEWEYRRLTSPLDSEPTVTIVRFEREKLVYMDSYKESERPVPGQKPRHGQPAQQH